MYCWSSVNIVKQKTVLIHYGVLVLIYINKIVSMVLGETILNQKLGWSAT